MNTLLATFKYESQLNTCTATNYTNGELVNEIVTLLRAGSVAMTGWDKGHHLIFDNPGTPDEEVKENHTMMEVRLEIHDSPDGQKSADWHHGGDALFDYVLGALETGEPEVRYFYTNGKAPVQKSVIGIEIHPAY